jgi:hypothetical protein
VFPIGSILEVSRGFYRHVATYLGDGKVLHNTPEAGVHVASVEEFADGATIRVRHQPSGSPDPFLQRAEELSGSRKRYNWVTNNCEHTAYGAVFGRAFSPQILRAGLTALVAGAAAIWAVRQRGSR